jgi:phosphoserine aminotransferase
MSDRKWNFNPGPAIMPVPALEKARDALLNYQGSGLGVMEISHRSKEFAEIHAQAKERMRKIMGIPDTYEILFFGGGANLQFSLVPLNLLAAGKTADYVDTGTWSTKAIQAGGLVGKVNVAASSKDKEFTYIPKADQIKWTPGAAYAHVTSNNTIKGTQYHTFPDTGSVPLVCDMSSDILCRRLDVSKFGLIYAGAQKNLGPAGVTVVVIRKDVAELSPENLPPMMNYKKFMAKDSLFNTPPSFAIYMVGLVLEWIESQGGIDAVEKVNANKAELLYGYMDQEADFYRGTVAKDSRSWMNVPMRLPSEDLEKKLIQEGADAGFVGLKGHRSVGGIRVSMYNAMPLEGIEQLVDFMKKFRAGN